MANFNTDIATMPGMTGHQKMTVWHLPGDDCSLVVDALSTKFELEVLHTLDDINLDAEFVLLLYTAPAWHIYSALQQGHAPSLALLEWCDLTEDILQLNRRNRRHALLLEVAMIGHHPQAFFDHFDLPKDPGMIESLAALAPEATDKILHLLAQHSLNSDPTTRILCEELEAAALNFSGGANVEPNNPDQVFIAYNTTKQAQEMFEVLQLQNQHIHSEIEILTKSRAALDKKSTQLSQKLAFRQAELAENRQKGAALDQENQQLTKHIISLKASETQLRQRLEQLNQGLESSQKELLDTHQQVDLLQAHNRAMHEELEVMHKDNLQHIRLIETQTQNSSNQKNEIRALRTRNTGLETQSSNKGKAILTAGSMVRDLEAHITELKTSVDKARKISKQTESRAVTLEAELQRITESKSFQLTAPLRRLRYLISGRR